MEKNRLVSAENIIMDQSNDPITTFFSFDNLKILAAHNEENTVMIQGYETYDEALGFVDPVTPCVLVIDRDEFHDIMDEWLDGKSHYFNNGDGGFAGVGFHSFEDCQLVGSTDVIIDVEIDENDNMIEDRRIVNIYFVTNAEMEMEHG